MQAQYRALPRAVISKIAAVKCHIVRIKCTKFDFRWGFAPDPVGGAYSTPPNPLAAFKGPTSNGGEREREWNGREERASHIAAALGLAKPRAGPDYNKMSSDMGSVPDLKSKPLFIASSHNNTAIAITSHTNASLPTLPSETVILRN